MSEIIQERDIVFVENQRVPTEEFRETEVQQKLIQAQELYDKGSEVESLELLTALESKVQDFKDHSFELYKLKGNIFLKRGDLTSCEQSYNRAMEIYPESDVLLVNFGTFYLQLSNAQQAKEFFVKALKTNPLCSKAWVGLALVHKEFGDLELAWANIEKALDTDPENKTALQLLLDWGIKSSKFDQLIYWLETLIKGQELDYHLELARVQVYFVSGRFKDVSRLLNEMTLLFGETAEIIKMKQLSDDEVKKLWREPNA